MLENRDEILKMDDAALSRLCELEFFKGSGNGGQKRNHTNTAIRLVHQPSGLVVTDCETRSQQRNRELALSKLRHEIAVKIRGPHLPPPDPHMNLNNPRYPLLAAWLMDAVTESGLDLKTAAAATGLTRTGLLKLLSRDAGLWQYFCGLRKQAGLPDLHP